MIRKREERDTDEIINIWHEASSLAHSFLKADFVEKARQDMRDVYIPNTETWVYEDDDRVIGFISMMGNEIGGLFVLPDKQSQGVGTQLVDFVKEFHNELEVEVFEKNIIGRAFYKKYGFIQIKQYYHAESGNDVLRLHFKN